MPEVPRNAPAIRMPRIPRNRKGKEMNYYIVVDAETKTTAEEVGGWGKKHLMEASVAVAWHSGFKEFIVFRESALQDLAELMVEAPLVVGFNTIDFDCVVLQKYAPKGIDLIKDCKHFDVLHEYKKVTGGKRCKATDAANACLGTKKSADGLAAVRWWKQGKIEYIIDYCKDDVALERDLYLHVARGRPITCYGRTVFLRNVPEPPGGFEIEKEVTAS